MEATDVCAILARSLNEQWQVYGAQLVRCQAEFSEDAVHDLRVATRRLMATLAALQSIVPADRLTETRRRIKKRLDALSPLRDAQVQSLLVQEMLPSFPELQPFHDDLLTRIGRLTRQAGRVIRVTRTARLQKTVNALMRRLEKLPNDAETQGKHLTAAMGAADAAFRRVVKRRRRIDAADSTTIHRMRLAFKKFRYMVEALQPFLEGVGEEQHKRMNTFQVKMGDIRDLEVLMADLKAFASGRKRKAIASSLERTQEELARRHTALVETFMSAADQVFTFWGQDRLTAVPPAKVSET